jgi:transcriptional regulator with XRE-family HTH domain
MENVGVLFGGRVRAFRVAKKLTQEALGHAAGIDYKHLSAIERGAKTPSFDAIGKLAKALGVECWQLFIPDRRLTTEMLREISSAADGRENLDQVQIREFLRNIRSAARKLNRTS